MWHTKALLIGMIPGMPEGMPGIFSERFQDLCDQAFDLGEQVSRYATLDFSHWPIR